MTEQLESLNLLSKTIFLATRDDVNALMMAMDVMLLPSFYEGLPLVLVEAQSTALMCIVSDKVTRLISISDYIVYRGIEVSDTDSWVDSMIEYTKPYKRGVMKSIITEKHFNIVNEVDRLVNLYEFGLNA